MKKSSYIYCFLFSVILFSVMGCRPKGILSSKQMEDIFVDLHTAEGILQESGYLYGHDEQQRAYYVMILEKHHTTQAQFDSSLVWYTANPTIFDKIYPKVIERLQAQLDTFNARLDGINSNQPKTIEEWCQRCIYGIDWLYWKKNYEKNDTKFAYIKKIL